MKTKMPSNRLTNHNINAGSNQPLLYRLREYVELSAGGTTTCQATTTSPVAEYTPDD